MHVPRSVFVQHVTFIIGTLLAKLDAIVNAGVWGCIVRACVRYAVLCVVLCMTYCSQQCRERMLFPLLFMPHRRVASFASVTSLHRQSYWTFAGFRGLAVACCA